MESAVGRRAGSAAAAAEEEEEQEEVITREREASGVSAVGTRR